MQRQVRPGGRLLLASLLLAHVAAAETTVWLVRPLYPGQEALVERTEKALDKLMPGDARKAAIIGQKELASALKGKKADQLPCFSAESRCADPIDAYVATLGFERIVLIQGGQDEAGFKYRVTAYEAANKKTTPASATNAVLERALLGAVAKVVPAASTLDVKSNPPGATVYIDDVKVGTTPLTTQVLPGERVVKLDLKLHQPIEETIIIPIRGSAALDKTLEKVAARLVVTASPSGASISIDGQPMGKDKLDRGILPGKHTIRITADNHKAFEQTIEVKADEQYVMDKTLEPLPGAVVLTPNGVPTDKGNALVTKVEPPPPPPTETQMTYDRKSYVTLSYEYGRLLGRSLVAIRFGTDGFGRTENISSSSRELHGVDFEYGTYVAKYFGFAIVGATYLTNADKFSMNVGFAPGKMPEVINGVVAPNYLDDVRIHLARIRVLGPQLRIAAWRTQFSLQITPEFQSGGVVESLPENQRAYRDGFLTLDFMITGRFNFRFYIVDGLFANLAANYTYYITGATTDANVRSSSSWGFNGGLGYGF